VIIGDESPLRRLPGQLDRKQMLYLDGIRYSIEMADLAHLRLQQTLLELANHSDDSAPMHLYFVAAVQDAWSIVDSVHRLRGLLHQAPGIKRKSPGLRLFDQRTAEIEPLRNSVQHLNSQINSIVSQNIPVWGILSWFTMTDPNMSSGVCCTLIAGTMFESKGHLVVNPLGKNLALPVDLITLSASGHTICLSDVMSDVERITRSMEQQLEKQFTNFPQVGSDVLIRLTMAFGDRKSDEGT
jgi:hypothetical protein